MESTGLSREYISGIIGKYCVRWGLRSGFVVGALYASYYVSKSLYHLFIGTFTDTPDVFLKALLGGSILFTLISGAVAYIAAYAWVLIRLTTAGSKDAQMRILIRLEGEDEELDE